MPATLAPTPRTFRGQMAPTRTFARRWWLWIPTPGLPMDGFLLLGQVAEKSYDVSEDTYGVQEVRCSWPGGRSFCLRKCGAEPGGEDEQYTTTVLPRGSQCSCKAGKTRQEVCKHRSGLEAAIAAGAIPRKQIQGA